MDLAAYFTRIGYDGPRTATRAVLADLVLHHACSIPFENLDALLGRRISLDPVDVGRKLVQERRGGWCFEQNLLFGEVLRALGFEVTDLAARVVWGRTADALAARTHRVLRVGVEGCDCLVDVGFGGQTPTGVLELFREGEQATPHEPFRLRPIDTQHVLETRLRDEWLPMFRFDLQPQLPIDFEAANFQLVHDPASHFTQGLRISRATGSGRWSLRGFELAWHGREGDTQRQALTAVDDVLTVLQERFDLAVGHLPELGARLQTLLQG